MRETPNFKETFTSCTSLYDKVPFQPPKARPFPKGPFSLETPVASTGDPS